MRVASFLGLGRRRAGVAFVLATVSSCGAAGFPKTGSEGGKPWVRVDARHVSLLSHQDEGAALRTAEKLELWWEAMSHALPAAGPDDASFQMTVLAVRNGWEADGVNPTIRGTFMTFPPHRLLYVGDPDNADGTRVIRHELAHAVIHTRLYDVPTWLNEGLAKYLETADYDEQSNVVTLGAMNMNDVREVAMWRRPLVKTIVSDDWPASDRGLLTFRAGTLVHMLFNRHEDEMSCFLGALAGREPRRQAFPRCFTTFGSWDSEMQDYEWIVRFPTRTIRVEPRAVSLEKSSVSDAQVHTWLALLDIGLAEMVEKLFRGVYADRAERSLKRALTLDPTEPLAVAAAIRWLPGERPRFDALTAGVVAAHPLDWRAWRLRAGTPGLAAEEANRACEEMVKLVPDGLDEAELSPCSRD